ncbi:cysteine hydrolase family protein [Myxococcota bacterium]
MAGAYTGDMATLVDLIHRMGSTVDAFDTDDARRFNDRERQKLIEGVAKAPLTEVQEALKAVRPGVTLRDNNKERTDLPLWLTGDESFRMELQSTLQARAKHLGHVTRGKTDVSPSPPEIVPDVQKVHTKHEPNSQKKFAVLLIDASYGRASKSPGIVEEKACMSEVLERANAREIPVFEAVWPGFFETDEDFDDLRQSSWVRVDKFTVSAFRNTNLADELLEREVTDLIVMGQHQEYCVRGTAIDAYRLGIKVHVGPQLVQGHRDFSGWKGNNPPVNVVTDYRQLPIFDPDDDD